MVHPLTRLHLEMAIYGYFAHYMHIHTHSLSKKVRREENGAHKQTRSSRIHMHNNKNVHLHLKNPKRTHIFYHCNALNLIFFSLFCLFEFFHFLVCEPKMVKFTAVTAQMVTYWTFLTFLIRIVNNCFHYTKKK